MTRRYSTRTAQRARVVEIHQTETGRWSALVECPDGQVRRLTCRARESVVVQYVKRSRRPVRTRFDILQRDNFTCRYCGRSAPSVVLQVDHIVAVADGGTDEPANLVTACADCNEGKGDRHSGGVLEDRPELHATMEDRKREALMRLDFGSHGKRDGNPRSEALRGRA